jgi:ring-1,2-phenylacetyl-CoA epoxidase subunit PaaC
MKADLKTAMAAKLLAMADDELVLGHRDSEWCGHAPILEEDIAFANIALDEIGHAILWYGLHADLVDENRETYPDKLAYERPASAYRSARIVELPKGDWAFSMMRQYLFDAYEMAMLERLAASRYSPVSEAAAKIRKEEIYHLRHTKAWVRRLGLGTEESHQRMQAALDALWPAAAQLFEPVDGEAELIAAGHVPDPAGVRCAWEEEVGKWLTDAGLALPPGADTPGDRDQHTEYLAALLDDLQQVTRQYPGLKW